MKVLLAGKYTHLGRNPIGGLQSWIETVGTELERCGHTVDYWEPHDFPSCNNSANYGKTFDIGILANIELTRPALVCCRKSILVSHGIIEAEKPDLSCDRLMFVSEGVQNHWGLEGEIIRQPIDLNFWRPEAIDRTMVTRYSYRGGNTHCKAVAKHLGLNFHHAKGVSHLKARKAINKSKIVFATGRAALESMACDVPTVIYDHRSAYQAPLLGVNVQSEMENSYSGRSGFTPSREQLLAATKDTLEAGGLRSWVAKHHDVRNIVNQLL